VKTDAAILGAGIVVAGVAHVYAATPHSALPSSPASPKGYAGQGQAYRIFFTTDTKCNLRFASFFQAQNDFKEGLHHNGTASIL
jgi:hypothetical protein